MPSGAREGFEMSKDKGRIARPASAGSTHSVSSSDRRRGYQASVGAGFGAAAGSYFGGLPGALVGGAAGGAIAGYATPEQWRSWGFDDED